LTTLILLLIFPLLWPVGAKLIWKQELTLEELGINLLVGVLITVGGWYFGRFMQMADREILNGAVTQKYSEHVSCEHSYSCNCREVCSGSDDQRSCSQTCDTCFEHPYDESWMLSSTVGSITIDRVDRRGTTEPPRFTLAKIGDPVAQSHVYTNYIKASPDSLFNAMSEKDVLATYKDRIPAYPSEVYDYHYVDRVLPLGVPLPDVAGWNLDLATRLKTLGPLKQVNLVLIFTKEPNSQFAEALRVAWLGGKKNDVIVVLGTPSFPNISWVSVISWTDNEIFKVQLRDALLDLKTVDRTLLLSIVESHILKSFVRKPMADFEYLKELIEPPTWVVWVLLLVSTFASVGTSIALSRNTTRVGRYRRW
jgi:hypothetical protein